MMWRSPWVDYAWAAYWRALDATRRRYQWNCKRR